MDERFTEELPNTPPTVEFGKANSRHNCDSGKSQASFYLAHQTASNTTTLEKPLQPQPYPQEDLYQKHESYEPQHQAYQASDLPYPSYHQPSQPYELSQDQRPPNYPQVDSFTEPYQSPYQSHQPTHYQQPLLSSERDEEEFRFVSSRLADVEEASEPLIKSSDLMKPEVSEQRRPGSEEAALKREIAYQEEMRRRLQRQQEEFAQMAAVVPPLNLSHASTPREEGVRDSLDISLRSDSEEDAVGPGFDPQDFYKQGNKKKKKYRKKRKG